MEQETRYIRINTITLIFFHSDVGQKSSKKKEESSCKSSIQEFSILFRYLPLCILIPATNLIFLDHPTTINRAHTRRNRKRLCTVLSGCRNNIKSNKGRCRVAINPMVRPRFHPLDSSRIHR